MAPPTAPDRHAVVALDGMEAGGRPPASMFLPALRGTRSGGGFTLLELVVATTILALLATLAVPPLRRQIAQHRVRLAASEVASALWTARGAAIRYGVAVAIRFEFEDSHAETAFSLYADGDGDGVRTADLNSGTDPRIGRPARLLHVGSGVRFGIPDDLVPAAFTGSGRLDRLDDPVRFGRSDLASFSPAGTASPGTVFLTDGHHLFAVRVYSRTGKIQVLRYVRDRELWKGV